MAEPAKTIIHLDEVFQKLDELLSSATWRAFWLIILVRILWS